MTSPGLIHILATPSPLSFGDGPYPPTAPTTTITTLFREIDHAASRTDHETSESSVFISPFLAYVVDANGRLDTVFPKRKKEKKKSPVFIIRSICIVISSAVIALSTGNRIFLLRRVSSWPASQDIYCYCHNDLIEAKEPFVGSRLFALQMKAPLQG